MYITISNINISANNLIILIGSEEEIADTNDYFDEEYIESLRK